MELGIYTFGDIIPDPNTLRAISISQRYAEILDASKDAGVGGMERLARPISGRSNEFDCGNKSPIFSRADFNVLKLTNVN